MKKQLFLAVFIFLFCSQVFAEEQKTTPKQNLQTINSITYSEGEAFGNHTRKESFNSFAEYPISQKNSIGGSIQLAKTYSNYNGSTSLYSLNFVEIFHRYKFFSYKNFGFTIQNSYKEQGIYNENKNLALMPKQSDYELRLLIAHKMKERLVNQVVANESPYFSRLEIAYRKKFSNPFDEFRLRFLLGLKIDEKFSFLFQEDAIWNLRAKSTAHDNSNSNFSNFNASKDANIISNFSFLYHVDKSYAVQLGYIKRLGGNSPFYDHSGFIVGLWNSF
jgi:hypothetical protein